VKSNEKKKELDLVLTNRLLMPSEQREDSLTMSPEEAYQPDKVASVERPLKSKTPKNDSSKTTVLLTSERVSSPMLESI